MENEREGRRRGVPEKRKEREGKRRKEPTEKTTTFQEYRVFL